MKLSQSLALLAFAFIVSALFKIMHWPHSDTVMVVAFVLEAVAVVLLIAKLATHPKVKEFLNR
ncbi:GldL-related protein [Chitinophaga cymbidii]|uniref:Gliding motility protein GldL-like N-terminal domain-containing protein n=1 Tax=Chitinophaga cymbidii TaxID=1096750 RepID=A0A512RQ45_9BACT|nr:gliding motility protein GldL [Chitinophaga cymbidii]GEP97816.1 hypothetical protein CCY01nite_40760 [Chitinophaga cymbidii]